jgi:hypothetical protein
MPPPQTQTRPTPPQLFRDLEDLDPVDRAKVDVRHRRVGQLGLQPRVVDHGIVLPMNTDRSVYRSGPHGGTLTPWTRGVSGNPLGGRVGLVALARRVREETGDGQELVQLFLTIMRGEPVRHSDGKMRHPKLEHRMWAAAWLADRGWGRAKELIELTTDRPAGERVAALARLSAEDRQTLREILARAFDEAPDPAPAPELPPPEG